MISSTSNFKKSIFIFLVLVMVYSGFIALFLPQGGSGLNQWQENRIRLQNYAYSFEKRRCVIAGSSMSSRIVDALLDPRDYNLSVSGGSAFTGLEVLARSHQLPDCVLIEVNATLFRPVVEKTISEIFNRISYTLKSSLPILRDAYQPVNVFGSWIKNRNRQPKPDVTAFDYDYHIRGQTQEETVLPKPEELEAMTNDLEARVRKLQANGVKIFFFDTHRHPDVEKGAKNALIHAKVRSKLDPQIFKWLDLNTSELFSTEDGQHLTTSAAIRFTRLLSERLNLNF